MKKIITVLVIMVSLIASAEAQEYGIYRNQEINMEVFNIVSTIVVIVIFLIFILTMVKRIFENRLKNKIVEKGIPESVVSSLLRPNNLDSDYANVKWFAILFGIGTGLTVINYTLPLGIHSLAIISFSMAISFLGYHFFLQKKTKP